MRRRVISVVTGLLVSVLAFGTMQMGAYAANKEGESDYTTELDATSGVFGYNKGFQWSYDEDTKTLTVTGEDDYLQVSDMYLSSTIKENVDRVIFKDCTVGSGGVSRLMSGLESVQEIKFENFDCSNASNMWGMFSECSELTSLDLSGLDTGKVEDMSNMFYNCSSLISLDLSNFDTSNVTNMDGMFWGCSNLTDLNVSGFDVANVTDMEHMFAGCSELTCLDLSSFRTSSLTDIWYMFSDCSSLRELNVNNFDTSNITNMMSIFKGCKSLKSLDLSSFDTSNAIYMMSMFEECNSLVNLDLSSFNTSKVETMMYMFYNCSSLTSLDVSSFDTTNVGNMGAMFSGCSSLENLDVSNFDTSNVVSMGSMFSGCNSLTGMDLSDFNTNKTENIPYLFYNCSSLVSLDISGFDFENIYNWSEMLDGCSNLSIIYTPQNIEEYSQTIYLPETFYDSEDNSYTTLTSENCNKTLVRKYNITYHLDGGTNSADNPRTYNILTETVALKAPTKDGYTFDGWYTDSEFTTKVTEIVKGSIGDKEFYAKWSEIMTPEKLVQAFVERMYTVALGRDADSQGVAFWTEQLLTHQADGAGLSQGFILSDEFTEKNYSDAEYVKVLYKTFFNREADESGIAFWISEMNNGKSRRSVLAGFVNSNEFDELCTGYGIERGTMEEEEPGDVMPDDTGIQGFVERLYVIALERPSEPSGLADWTRRIESGENTPEDVAKFFFLSAEYVEKGTGNDKYIEALYLVFMDRASEPGGKAYWVSELEKGTGREAALEGFAQSQEFQEIMDRYGL